MTRTETFDNFGDAWRAVADTLSGCASGLFDPPIRDQGPTGSFSITDDWRSMFLQYQGKELLEVRCPRGSDAELAVRERLSHDGARRGVYTAAQMGDYRQLIWTLRSAAREPDAPVGSQDGVLSLATNGYDWGVALIAMVAPYPIQYNDPPTAVFIDVLPVANAYARPSDAIVENWQAWMGFGSTVAGHDLENIYALHAMADGLRRGLVTGRATAERHDGRVLAEMPATGAAPADLAISPTLDSAVGRCARALHALNALPWLIRGDNGEQVDLRSGLLIPGGEQQ